MKGSRIHVSPAYGRDYKTEELAQAAWNAGKDFQMEGFRSGMINKGDADNYGVPGGEINVRYNGKADVLVIDGLKVNGEI